MAQKLWEKNVQVDHEVDIFTVGKDREMDLYLAKYDVLGSMAHITMLESIGLLTKDELSLKKHGLISFLNFSSSRKASRMCTRRWNSCLHAVWAIWARRSIAGVPAMIRFYWI